MISYKNPTEKPIDRQHILYEFTQEQINAANDNVEKCLNYYSTYNYSDDTFTTANDILINLRNFIQQGADIKHFPKDFMKQIFYGLMNRYVVKHDHGEHDGSLIPLISFFDAFSNSTDNDCYFCRDLEYANVLTTIYKSISDTHILYEVEKILINLVNNKPQTSSCFNLADIYQRTCQIYNTIISPDKSLYTFTMNNESFTIQEHKCITRALELNTSILVLLGDDIYKLGLNPVDYMKTSIELMIRGDRFCHDEKLFDYQTKFLISQIRSIFRKTPFEIWHKLAIEDIFVSIIKKLSRSPEIELLALDLLVCIAESNQYNSYFILVDPTFISFTPTTMETATWYCKVVTTCLNMIFYSDFVVEFPKFVITNNFTVSADQRNDDDRPFNHVMQIAKSLEGCGDYIVQKSSIMVLAALFNIQNEMIFETILREFPDFVDRIVTIIDEHNPKDVLHIVNTLRMIKDFVDKKEMEEKAHLVATREALKNIDNLNIIEGYLEECEDNDDQEAQAGGTIIHQNIMELLNILKNAE